MTHVISKAKELNFNMTCIEMSFGKKNDFRASLIKNNVSGFINTAYILSYIRLVERMYGGNFLVRRFSNPMSNQI